MGAALHNVAIANLRAGSLDDAMDAIEEAIKIRSRALGRSHPKVAVRVSSPRLPWLRLEIRCMTQLKSPHLFVVTGLIG